MELILEQDNAKMRNGYIIFVHMIAVFLRSERILDIYHYKFVLVELISDLTSRPTDLLGSDNLSVKFVGCLDGISGNCYCESGI